jgi:hypothetical protein
MYKELPMKVFLWEGRNFPWKWRQIAQHYLKNDEKFKKRQIFQLKVKSNIKA